MVTAPAKGKPCKGISKRSGKPCGGFCMSDSDYCLAHDPRMAAQRRLARSKGGKARHGLSNARTDASPIQIESMADVIGVVADAINAERCQPNSSRRNQTLGGLAKVMIEALKVGEMEQEIVEIKAILKAKGML